MPRAIFIKICVHRPLGLCVSFFTFYNLRNLHCALHFEGSNGMDENHRISFKTTWQNMKSDLARYRITEQRSSLASIIISPGVLAGMYYRLGHWIWYAESKRELLRLLRPLYIIGKRFVEIYTGISVSPQAIIGPGLYFNHFGSIFIGASTI